MNIYAIQFGWFYGKDGDEEYAKVRAKVKATIDIDLDPEDSYGRAIVDGYQLLALIDAGLEPKVEKSHKLSLKGVADLSKLIAKLEAKINGIPDVDSTYNQHCEVHVPNMALMTYNDVMLLEDSCTDELQKALDSGWRIIACCPQAQRRPDYILGRFNPETDYNNKNAKRGIN